MAHDFKKYPELANSQMPFYYFDSPHRQIIEDFNATVIRVKDGDTIQVRWDERDFDFPVRMADIAAPELKEAGGLESAAWLRDEIEGEEVTIVIDQKNRVGKWGRLLGDIIHLGRSMSELSLNLGYSMPFKSEVNPWP
jgi:endonuclease YncB( thermonuclease family)